MPGFLAQKGKRETGTIPPALPSPTLHKTGRLTPKKRSCNLEKHIRGQTEQVSFHGHSQNSCTCSQQPDQPGSFLRHRRNLLLSYRSQSPPSEAGNFHHYTARDGDKEAVQIQNSAFSCQEGCCSTPALQLLGSFISLSLNSSSSKKELKDQTPLLKKKKKVCFL